MLKCFESLEVSVSVQDSPDGSFGCLKETKIQIYMSLFIEWSLASVLDHEFLEHHFGEYLNSQERQGLTEAYRAYLNLVTEISVTHCGETFLSYQT